MPGPSARDQSNNILFHDVWGLAWHGSPEVQSGIHRDDHGDDDDDDADADADADANNRVP